MSDSLVTLAVQNAALAIVMHYSRVSIPPSQAYAPSSAVLMNEILKGSISFVIAMYRSKEYTPASPTERRSLSQSAFTRTLSEVLSPDCWKLSIPAILYVIQNTLQFVAVANLPVATFQVTYQLKILTTAFFSVMLLGKRLTRMKWAALLLLAAGVAFVQIQTTTPQPSPAARAAAAAAAAVAEERRHRTHKVPVGYDAVGSAVEYAPPDPELDIHIMHPLMGFGAVAAACFTSGLAGVYFEMVLKGSKADLWVRNVQLSLFSLIPAVLPVLTSSGVAPNGHSGLFANFGGWAWATVFTQVAGGLVTAIVIKHADNILKGFATSLSILLSFLASVALFDFALTPSFIGGAGTVLFATYLYNQPAHAEPALMGQADALLARVTGNRTPSGPGSPVTAKDPIIAEFAMKRTRSSPLGSSFNLSEKSASFGENLNLYGHGHAQASGTHLMPFGQTEGTQRYLYAPYGSPFASPVPSRGPSRAPSPSPTPPPGPPGPPPRRTPSRLNSYEGRSAETHDTLSPAHSHLAHLAHVAPVPLQANGRSFSEGWKAS
jgi:UDP-sugar transporter A1/2/3